MICTNSITEVQTEFLWICSHYISRES